VYTQRRPPAREDSRAATQKLAPGTQNKGLVIMDYGIFRKQVYRRTGGQRDSSLSVTNSVQGGSARAVPITQARANRSGLALLTLCGMLRANPLEMSLNLSISRSLVRRVSRDKKNGPLQEDIAMQRTAFRSAKSITGAALVWLGLAILFGKPEGPAVQLTSLLGIAAKETLGLLPYFVPAALRGLQGYAFDHQLSPCSVHMLVSFWPLIRVMAGAV
jgi:hypothetical protein